MAVHNEVKKPVDHQYIWDILSMVAYLMLLSVIAMLIVFFVGILFNHMLSLPR